MRFAFAALLLAATLPFTVPAQAEKWCSVNNDGNRNCSFDNITQCREASWGGGFCAPDTAAAGHRQPTAAGVASAATDPVYTTDPQKKRREEFDAVVERATKRTQGMNLCRGC